MRAANEGAHSVDPKGRGRSIGINIELPFEQEVNPFVTQAFTHRTFFSRLHHFMIVSDAFVVMPGGIGSLLELALVWQLLQVRKLYNTPLILVGEMWGELIEWGRAAMLRRRQRARERGRFRDPALREHQRSRRPSRSSAKTAPPGSRRNTQSNPPNDDTLMLCTTKWPDRSLEPADPADDAARDRDRGRRSGRRSRVSAFSRSPMPRVAIRIMSNDPNACASCHIMRDHLDAYTKSSHRSVATCNDCHTPPGLIPKYLTKAEHGFFHSLAFTTDQLSRPDSRDRGHAAGA